MKIVLTGVSGLIGRPLVAELAKRHDLVVFKRKLPLKQNGKILEVFWNPLDPSPEWMKLIDGADVVVNLSGEGIAEKRWSLDRKQKLRDSRVDSTNALVAAIAAAQNKPRALINASAIGFYGALDEKPVSENALAGFGFLSDICQEWEKEALKAEAFGVRVVLLRTGVVLAKEGGALSKMLPPFKLGLGGPIGNGRQYLSWIHLEDEVAAIVRCIEDSAVSGPVNLTAPQAVSMKEFAKTLGRVLSRPAIFPVPAFVLKVALGEMSEMLLTGQNVVPSALESKGFRFKYPQLEPALRQLLGR